MKKLHDFKLTQSEVRELATKNPTPFLVVSLDKIEENYRFLRENMPRAGVYYAMKANPDRGIGAEGCL